MLPSPLAALLVALLSSVFVQEVGGAAPLFTLPLERRAFHNAVSRRPPSHWENVKNGLRAKFGSGKAKLAAIEAIQRRDELAKRATGTVPLIDQYSDTNYMVSISLGTPPQQFNVIPDTGSSETWVLGPQCLLCSNGARFDPLKSSTYVPMGLTTQFKYGSGSVVVDLAFETIAMGGFKSTNERISTASQSSQAFLQGSTSGILGLAFPSLMATADSIPWWIRLIKDGQLGQNETMFSFWLSRYWGTSQQMINQELPGGQLTLGGVNKTLFTGDINYIGLSDVNWWTIPMDSVVVNGKDIALPAAAKNAIIDTGTTLVGGPKEILDQIFSSINGSTNAGLYDPRYEGYYMMPCSALGAISIGLKFGGQTYIFAGIDLILEDVSTTPGLNGMCLSALFVLGSVLDNQILGASGPAWLVGDAFLKNVYSVFRYETNVTGAISGSVGFARLSGVDGRLTTNGVPLYSNATSTSGLSIPTTSGLPSSVAPIPDPLANHVTSNGNRVASDRLQSRGFKYGALVIGVSLLLSLV